VWIPANRSRTTIQNWGRRDLPPGTLRAIIRDLGIDRVDFEKA
jgi:hypothetical protein